MARGVGRGGDDGLGRGTARTEEGGGELGFEDGAAFEVVEVELAVAVAVAIGVEVVVGGVVVVEVGVVVVFGEAIVAAPSVSADGGVGIVVFPTCATTTGVLRVSGGGGGSAVSPDAGWRAFGPTKLERMRGRIP